MSQINVRTPNGDAIPRANLWYYAGHHDTEPRDRPEIFKFDVFTDLAGNAGWPIPHFPVQEYTVFVNTYNVLPQFAAASAFLVPTARGEYGDTLITLQGTGLQPKPAQSVSRLLLAGTMFRNEANERVFLRGATLFVAFETFLDRGPDALRDVLGELQRYRCNAIRVFGMSRYIQENEFGRPPFNPATYGDRFYEALPLFCQFAASFGMYVYWSVFPDRGDVMPDDAQCVRHWDRFIEAIDPEPNNVVEVTNEPDAHGFNYINPFMLRFPNRIPACPGSYGENNSAYASGTFPAGSDWGNGHSFGDLHPMRRYPAAILDCAAVNNVYYLHNRGLMIGEPDRYGSNGNSNVEQARLAAAAGCVGALGVFFHSTKGKRAEVFDDQTRACADAWFGALAGV